MAELRDILNSGDISDVKVTTEIDINGQQVGALLTLLLAGTLDGIALPGVAAVDASINSIFFNTDNDRVCWKRHNGDVYRFNMSLV